MTSTEDQRISRTLAYMLRHAPEEFRLTMDHSGWVLMDEVVAGLSTKFPGITTETVLRLVVQDSKSRYSVEGAHIRAAQGHSARLNVVTAVESIPTEMVLFHGTVRSVVPAILSEGLKGMSRSQVHLSADVDTAEIVAGRRSGETVILEVNIPQAVAAGLVFHQSTNGVWLTEHVPAAFITERA